MLLLSFANWAAYEASNFFLPPPQTFHFHAQLGLQWPGLKQQFCLGQLLMVTKLTRMLSIASSFLGAKTVAWRTHLTCGQWGSEKGGGTLWCVICWVQTEPPATYLRNEVHLCNDMEHSAATDTRPRLTSNTSTSPSVRHKPMQNVHRCVVPSSGQTLDMKHLFSSNKSMCGIIFSHLFSGGSSNKGKFLRQLKLTLDSSIKNTRPSHASTEKAVTGYNKSTNFKEALSPQMFNFLHI